MAVKITPTKPLLVMLYGYPGSGKSFFARQMCESLQAAHVHGDRIRTELFEKPRHDKAEDSVVAQLMDYMAHEFLNAGISVVYDTNSMRYSQRHALREMARRMGAQSVLIWFQIDAESAFTRVAKRDRRRLDDKYSSPMDRTTFDAVASRMQNPSNTEDYIVVSGKHVFHTQFSSVVKRLREIGLVNAGDASGHFAKPGMVNLVPNPLAGRVDMTRRNITIR